MTPPAAVVETHVSVLFFVGDRVYKLRKPVRFPFVDFGDREARLADCRREVDLNRRLSDDVYLGVADVVRDGRPVDHLVVMRRMPEGRDLASLAVGGEDLDGWVDGVAAVLAAFHAGAERSPEIDDAASVPAVSAAWDANFAETGRFVGPVLDATVDADIRELARRWVDGRGPLLESRIAAGRVCDGHGDLQAADTYCLDDGVRILDCLEFSDRLRHGDVVADVAFLAMDLERLGRPEAAVRFLCSYRAASGDAFPSSLAHHYAASRAYVRAKVACLRADQGAATGDGPAGAARARSEARALHELALDHLRRAQPVLVLVGGLPGTGKSTLADGLAAARGWTVLRTDEVRRRVNPAPDPSPGYRAGRYDHRTTERTYRHLLEEAGRSLGAGTSVVLDASWTSAPFREAARAVARGTSSALMEFRCVLDRREADERIERRLQASAGLSEATPEVAAAMDRSQDPWPTAVPVDTSGPAGEVLEQVLAAVVERGAPPSWDLRHCRGAAAGGIMTGPAHR